MKAAQLVVLLASLAGAAACERKARPWEGAPDGSVVDASRPFLPDAPRDGSWLGPASALPSSSAAEEPPPTPKKIEVRGGGLWRSCADGFSPSGDARKDVERLGLLCGPANGMKVDGEALTGEASERVATHPLPVLDGACYRVFAVASAGVEGLDLTVRSLRGSRLAGAEGGRVLMVDAERPFCTFANETLTLEVRARGGKGRYAVRIYQLPAQR